MLLVLSKENTLRFHDFLDRIHFPVEAHIAEALPPKILHHIPSAFHVLVPQPVNGTGIQNVDRFKLSIDKDGTITKTEGALKDNKGAEVISADGSTYYTYNKDTGALEAVEGGKDACDGVIKGSMNYYVAGVTEG